MSITHYLQTKIPFDFAALADRIAADSREVSFEQRAQDTGYFWVDRRSTRGVDVSTENGLIELRNTVMSNRHDYELTNFLARAIATLFNGELLEEYVDDTIEVDEDEQDNDSALRLVHRDFPVFSDDQITALEHSHTGVIKAIITQQNMPIALFGPVRKTHLGPWLLSAYANHETAELTEILHQHILNCNYGLPDYDYGNIMQMGDGENQKTLKLLTNKVDCIIDKYDYILFENADDYIAVTNDTLNRILPAAWRRVDEYTIVAPVLPPDEFEALVGRAAGLNEVEGLRNV